MKRVNSGAIVIVENQHLCFTSQIEWSRIKKSKDHDTVMAKNADAAQCGMYFIL